MGLKKTHEEFLKDVYELVGEDYTVISPYVNSRTKVKVLHSTCGEPFEVTPNNLLRGRGCSNCYTRRKLTHEEYVERVSNLVGDEYLPLEVYKSYTKPVSMKHNICGCIYKVAPANFIFNGTRCPDCFKDNIKTQEEFKLDIFKQLGDEYTVIGTYTGNKNKVEMMHKTCGHTYKAMPINILRGTRCPKCSADIVSKGEKAIALFLDNNKVRYNREVTFPDCRNLQPLRYDFSIQSAEGKLLFLLEFDGVQHFLPTRGKKELVKQQKNDSIKDSYCEARGLKLLRIAYTEYDSIEEILTEELEKEGVELYAVKEYIRDFI